MSAAEIADAAANRLGDLDHELQDDLTWYCVENWRGVSVFQLVARRQGFAADNVLEDPLGAELMTLGNTIVYWGYAASLVAAA